MKIVELKDTDQSMIIEERQQINNLLQQMEDNKLSKDNYKYLQYLLMKYECLYESNYSSAPSYPLCRTEITEDRIMFISDTHRGNSEYQMEKLINIAYKEAQKQNIKAIVHAGDFIEGTSFYHNKSIDDVLNELNTAIGDIPNELKIKLLLGNHDYSAIRTYSKIIEYFFYSSKIEILGMQKVLLDWNGDTIRINHPISQLKEPSGYNQNEIITLEGHHHYYEFLEKIRTINLPSLSKFTTQVYDQRLSEKNLRFICPFIIGEKHGNSLQFIKYCIDKSLTGQLYATEVIEANTKTRQLKLHTLL